MSINTIESIKLEAMRVVESQRQHQSRQIAEEGQQHFHDKLEKDKDKEKTRVNDPDNAEGKNINPDDSQAGDHEGKGGRKKKHEDEHHEPVKSIDPNKGKIIDIVT